MLDSLLRMDMKFKLFKYISMLYQGLLINITTFQCKHIFSTWILNISKTEGNGILRYTLNVEAGCSSKMLVPGYLMYVCACIIV